MSNITPLDIYNLKRQNFKEKTLKHFDFLVNEFGYSQPILSESIQPNGTVISDRFEYKNFTAEKTIHISNAYHPVDYGFEVTYWNTLNARKFEGGNLLEFCLKENQDLEQNYIVNIAEIVKEKYTDLIR